MFDKSCPAANINRNPNQIHTTLSISVITDTAKNTAI